MRALEPPPQGPTLETFPSLTSVVIHVVSAMVPASSSVPPSGTSSDAVTFVVSPSNVLLEPSDVCCMLRDPPRMNEPKLDVPASCSSVTWRPSVNVAPGTDAPGRSLPTQLPGFPYPKKRLMTASWEDSMRPKGTVG